MILGKSISHQDYARHYSTVKEESIMGLLSRKPKVTIQEFCQHFYDTYIFNALIGGADVDLEWWQNAYNSITEVDESFKSVDFSKFKEEMTALRMELFGLAWQQKFKSEQYIIPQSFFTRLYLQKIDKMQIWDIMGEYNQKIAMSNTVTDTGKQVGMAQITKLNLARQNMFNKWCEDNISNKDALTDEDKWRSVCVARVANRIGADIRHPNCATIIQLAARLAVRLDCDTYINSEAVFRLSALIFGLHEGAKEAIKDSNIHM